MQTSLGSLDYYKFSPQFHHDMAKPLGKVMLLCCRCTYKDILNGGCVGVVDEGGVALVKALQHQRYWHYLVCLIHQVNQHVCPGGNKEGHEAFTSISTLLEKY